MSIAEGLAIPSRTINEISVRGAFGENTLLAIAVNLKVARSVWLVTQQQAQGYRVAVFVRCCCGSQSHVHE